MHNYVFTQLPEFSCKYAINGVINSFSVLAIDNAC